MVGRDRELEALRGAASSGGSATIVEGPAGIGKSRLVRELAAWARGRGGVVLVGRCSATSADTPLRPMREALLSAARAGIRPPESMRSFLPTLARVVPEWSNVSVDDADPSTLVLGEGVLRLLHTLARPEASTVLVVEDLQWADAESLAVVEYLADNIAESAVAIVATLRTGVDTAGTSLAHTLVARRAADAVILRALDADDVMTMAHDIVGEELPRDAAATLQARSEGVPFLIEELLAAAEPTGWSAIDDAIPGSVTAPVTLRLATLPPEAVRLLRRAATLGRDFDWTVAARSAGVDESTAAELLRTCVHAQLVDVEGSGFRFHHALTRDAVLLAAGPVELKTAAAEALAALEEIDPDLEGERCHAAAMLASRAGQPERAASLLLMAATRAVDQGALASAEALLRRADAVASAEHRFAIDALLLRISALSGQVDRASVLGERLLNSAGSPTERADIHVEIARAALTAGHWPVAEDHAGAVAALVPEDEARRARATAISALAAMGRDDGATALPIAELALAQGRATRQPVVQCEALEVIGRAQRVHDTQAAEAAFGEAHRVATDAGLALWRVRALQELGTIDLFESLATERLTEARRAAGEVGALALAAVVDLQLAAVHDERGEADLALVAARRCEDASRRWGLATLPMSLTLQAMAHARLGNEVEMNAAGAAALATGEDSMNVEIGLWGNAYPIWHLAKGDLTAAAHAFDRAIAALRQLPGGAYPWPGLWALARTVADERGAEARRDVRSLPADTPVSRMMALAADAVAAGREGESSRAKVLFAEADGWLARMEGGFRRAIVRLLVAPAAHEAGWGEPEAWLRESLAVFDRNGLHDFAARCREALRDMHAPVPRRGGGSAVPPELAALGITSREVDVLSLVAGGLSNKQAAERLVISVRTVDKHVERLLMKAGTNRAGLVELANRAGLRT